MKRAEVASGLKLSNIPQLDPLAELVIPYLHG